MNRNGREIISREIRMQALSGKIPAQGKLCQPLEKVSLQMARELILDIVELARGYLGVVIMSYLMWTGVVTG